MINSRHIEVLTKRVKDELEECEISVTNHEVQEWVYRQEFENPTKIGKKEAEYRLKKTEEERKALEKRIENLKLNLKVYKDYLKEHGKEHGK